MLEFNFYFHFFICNKTIPYYEQTNLLLTDLRVSLRKVQRVWAVSGL